MAPVVKQAAGVAFAPAETAAAADQELWVIDTCQAWREDGPLHRLVRAGDEPGLRALSAYEPPPDV